MLVFALKADERAIADRTFPDDDAFLGNVPIVGVLWLRVAAVLLRVDAGSAMRAFDYHDVPLVVLTKK